MSYDQTPEEDSRRRAGKRFVGALLMAVGGLIAFLCGACALLFSIPVVLQSIQMGSDAQLGFLIIPALLGGLPAAGGIVVFLIGLGMFRDGRRRKGLERVFD